MNTSFVSVIFNYFSKVSRVSRNIMSNNIIWVDLEMTGLDVNKCTILEMACIVTDEHLNIIAEGPDICINHPDSVLSSMEPWSQEHHGKSGLTRSCKDSKFSLEETEKIMLDFVKKHTPPDMCPLAGNSISLDKMFLMKYMPHFTNHLSYRIVDVSSVKELCKRWYPKEYRGAPCKKSSHRAMEDIHESIKELKYYKTSIFKGRKD